MEPEYCGQRDKLTVVMIGKVRGSSILSRSTPHFPMNTLAQVLRRLKMLEERNKSLEQLVNTLCAQTELLVKSHQDVLEALAHQLQSDSEKNNSGFEAQSPKADSDVWGSDYTWELDEAEQSQSLIRVKKNRAGEGEHEVSEVEAPYAPSLDSQVQHTILHHFESRSVNKGRQYI